MSKSAKYSADTISPRVEKRPHKGQATAGQAEVHKAVGQRTCPIFLELSKVH